LDKKLSNVELLALQN